MKINTSFLGFDHSARGMSIQRKKMDLIAENLANIDNTQESNGAPYKRQFLRVTSKENSNSAFNIADIQQIRLKSTKNDHFDVTDIQDNYNMKKNSPLDDEVVKDTETGDMVYMPEHPDANENGYITMPNVNVVNEMVDMISATRGYEANLTAFNASKQLAKDSLEI